MDLKTIDSTNATTYVYNLQFVRSYNGSIAPSFIAPAPAGMSTTNANKEQYGRCANPEVLKVITDGKEVFWFEWTNPYVIEGTVNSNVSVINQDEAMTIALSHLKNLLVEKEATKLFINRIELNGSYITIKDERDTFLLIPVSDIGYQTLHDGSRYLGSPEYALSYVTINAVDGSIIDRNFRLLTANWTNLQPVYTLLRTCLPRTPDNRSMRKKGGAIRADGGFKSQAGGGLVGLFCCSPRRRGAHSAPFLSSGDTGGVPLGGAAFPRLPQRPYHGRAVIGGHGVGPAHTRRAAVHRVLH